jgi:predicted small secreted protein
MKKVIFALAIVSVSFVACNSGEDKKVEETKTSDTTTVVVPADTMTVVKDTTVKTTTTVDTLKK